MIACHCTLCTLRFGRFLLVIHQFAPWKVKIIITNKYLLDTIFVLFESDNCAHISVCPTFFCTKLCFYHYFTLCILVADMSTKRIKKEKAKPIDVMTSIPPGWIMKGEKTTSRTQHSDRQLCQIITFFWLYLVCQTSCELRYADNLQAHPTYQSSFSHANHRQIEIVEILVPLYTKIFWVENLVNTNRPSSPHWKDYLEITLVGILNRFCS